MPDARPRGSPSRAPTIGEMEALVRAKDWSQTPLGPMADWPQSLRTAVSLCLASNFPINIVWGPSHTQIYNDGYRVVCGDVHPRALGEDYSVTWASAWPAIGEPFARALEGHTSYLENQRMFLQRNGYLEETFFTFSHSPIRDESGGIGGLFHPVTETTAAMLSARRTRALRDLGTALASADTEPEAARAIADVLSRSQFDLPFLLVYRLDEAKAAPQGGAAGNSYRLSAHFGVEAPGPVAPECVIVDGGAAGGPCPWPIAQAVEAGHAVEVKEPAASLRGEPCGPYEEPPRAVLVQPVGASAVERPALVLVAGVSSRLPFDADYRGFYDLLGVTITAALAALRAREDERRRAEALAELDRAKTAFFSNVSHEFRTPLTLMIGPVEDMLSGQRASLAADQQHQLEIVHRNSLRLLKLVNTMLDFARIEAGRQQANYQPTDLAALTAELASAFRSACDRAGLALNVECSALGEPVYVDRDMWEKIVLNLLSNAFKFTLEGSIGVTLERARGHALLTVADTGVGIPAEELPRMFERFHRVAQTRARTHEGTGIGLALVHELVRLHGGDISVDSAPQRGSRFRVRIPLGAAHLDARQIGVESGLSSTATGAQAFVEEALRWLPDGMESRPRAIDAPAAGFVDDAPARDAALAERARIVWADDNADMRDYVSRLLGGHFDVEPVPDGEAALQAARRQRPDLVLSDIMMPGLDGMGLLRALRDDPATRDVPVILLSARAGEESRIEGLQSGADDYLIKPFSARELLARVEAHVKLSRVRRSAAEALRVRSEHAETLLNRAPVGIFLVDADFRFRAVNPVALPAFGDSMGGGVVGRDFQAVVRRLWEPQFADEVIRIFRHTMATGEPYATPQTSERRADRGVIEHYEWSVDRIALPEGRHGVVCYFRDISAHVKMNDELRAANRRKDEFVASLAHELRNPLAPIRNAAELLRRRLGGDSDVSPLTAMIERQVTTMARLLEDLLDVSRITQGKISLRHDPLQLSTVVQHAVETSRPLIDARRQHLEISQPGAPVHVRGDLTRLTQALSNLLNNASKYTPERGHIRLSVGADRDEATISVRDDGIGMPPEALPHVFELFVQLQPGSARSQGGLGVGLTLVRQIIELHQGSVTALSAGEGQGSEFVLRLPLDRARSAVHSQDPLPLAASDPQRILLVEDNADAAETTRMLLEMLGHTVRCAATGPAALAAARAFEPQVLLCDLDLPGGMSGGDVARELRARGSRMTMIALSGFGQESDRKQAFEAGFNHHLIKPVEIRALERALANAAPSSRGDE